MLIAGIEEAGRGPVIGPLVVCGVLVEQDRLKELMSIGVKDSKMLSPERREELFPKIKAIAKKVHCIKITAKEIDGREERGLNLNDLEAINMAKIADILKADRVIIDAPSTNIPAITKQIRDLMKHDCELILEHKADVKYPVVSAASIIAKVTRDQEVVKIEDVLKLKIGSGYPSDPITQKFLDTYWSQLSEIPFIRNSWDTIKRLKAKKGQMNISKYF
ncbi:ribonuclease HII [archaeon CG10_big_fil_rev_8_21_14_0_10_43_11]|nr:MAG: ribonuclease HII [archaeon CG10_big_fil_rev_8_21_14_0_10_43_11]